MKCYPDKECNILKKIIAKTTNFDFKDKNNFTPFYWAIENNKHEYIKLLIPRCNLGDIFDGKFLIKFTGFKNPNIVSEEEIYFFNDFITYMIIKSKKYNINYIKSILKYIDFKKIEIRPIFFAILRYNLRYSNRNVNYSLYECNNPIYKYSDIIKYIVKNINLKKKSKQIFDIIDEICQISCTKPYTWCRVYRFKVELINLTIEIVKKGFSIDQRIVKHAFKNNCDGFLEYIVQHCPKVITSQFFINAIKKNNRLYQDIIDNNLQLHEPDKFGSTPLMWLIYRKRPNNYIKKFILQGGCDMDHENNKGNTAYDIAASETIDNHKILYLLESN